MTCKHESELRYYRDLLSAVFLLYECSQALDEAPATPEDAATQAAWDAYWDAAEDVFEFVRAEEHADAMEAAGVACNELHHAKVTLTA